MKEYIIVDHKHLKRKSKEIKKQLRYINESTRVSLLIPFPAVVYKLNEEKKRYEPILHKYSQVELTFLLYFSTETQSRIDIPLVILGYLDNSFFISKQPNISIDNKKLSKHIKFFSRSFKQVFENIISMIKLFQLEVHLQISINAKKKLVTIDINTSSAKDKLPAFLSKNIKSLFNEHNITIKKSVNIQNDNGRLTIDLYIDNDIYDIEKINEQFSIPCQNVEKIKKKIKRKNASELKIDVTKQKDYNILKIKGDNNLIPRANDESPGIYINPDSFSAFPEILTEPVDLTLDELDQDFIKAMYLLK